MNTSVSTCPNIPGYELLELVGRGGMGKVYRAKHLALGRIVAIKVLAQEPDDKMLARFHEEARAVAKLQHPNIAQLFEIGLAQGRPFYSQEFLPGGSLAQKFAGLPQDPIFAAKILATVAEAIQHSHEHGILHRDLKPANVLLAEDGTPKVTDYGLAKELPTNAATSTLMEVQGLTRTGEIVGTPSYMPPEQASGIVSGLGPPADVYALGAMLYEALTGRPPFQSPEPLQTVLLVLSMEPVAPRTLLPKTPIDLNTICLKCLEKNPKRRYPSAKELAEDLRRFLAGVPILARPVGFVERTSKWAKRKKALAALVVVSVLFFLSMIGAAVWLAISNSQLADAKRDVESRNAELIAAKYELEKKNEELLRAKKESDDSYNLATQSVEDIVQVVSTKLYNLPQAEHVMLETYDKSADLFQRLRELRPNDAGTTRRYIAVLTSKLGHESAYGKPGAAKTRTTVQAVLQEELAKFPKDELLRGVEIRLVNDRVILARGNNDGMQLRELDAQLSSLADAYLRDFPTAHNAQVFQVWKYWAKAYTAGHAKEVQQQLAALSRAVETARKVISKNAEDDQRYVMLSSSLYQLAMMQIAAKKLSEADETLEELAKVHEAETHPYFDVQRRSGFATVALQRAGIASLQGDKKLAIEQYELAEGFLKKLTKEFPLTQLYHVELADALFGHGMELIDSGDLKEGVQRLDEAIASQEELVKLAPKNTLYAENLAYYKMIRNKTVKPKPPGN